MSCCRGLDPRGGSSAASWHATSTRGVYAAAVSLAGSTTELTSFLTPPGAILPRIQAHDLGRLPLRAGRWPMPCSRRRG